MVGEDSNLATMSRACSAGLTEALRWCVWWHDAGQVSLADVPPDRAGNAEEVDVGHARNVPREGGIRLCPRGLPLGAARAPCLPALQHDPHKQEDVLKVHANKD
jgi:hypothetical protein